MKSLQLLAVADMFAGDKLVPSIIVCALAAILLIALLWGWIKGYRKVSWGGIVWAATSALYFAMNTEYGKTLINGIKVTMKTKDGTVHDLSGLVLFALAGACVLVGLLVYGICALIFRRKRKKVLKREPAEVKRDIFGNEYEYDDDYDFDEKDEYVEILKKEKRGPSLLGRLMGSIFSLLNVAMAMLVILLVAVLIIDCTLLKTTLTALYEISVMEEPLMETVVPFAKQYALDIAIIGLMISIACKGRRKGLLESIRTLVTKVGSVALIVLAFYIPFSAQVAGTEANTNGMFYKFVRYFVDMMIKQMGGNFEMMATIVGQLIAGALMAIAVSIVMMILNFLLRKVNFALRKNKFIRNLDGSISCMVYLIIGMAVCIGVWAIICALDVYGVINASSLYNANAPISTGIHNVCKVFVEPFLQGLKF